MAGEGCRGFTCDACGRAMIAIGVSPDEVVGVCGACRTHPGWHRDPALRALVQGGGREGNEGEGSDGR